jgi:hypothetical protein
MGNEKATNIVSSYLGAKKAVTAKIVTRQTRGNVNIQNGGGTSREKLLADSRLADQKMQDIKKLVEAAN